MKRSNQNIFCLILILLCSCNLFEESSNIVISQKYNFSKTHKFIVFKKIGNATTSNSLHVSLMSSNSVISKKGNGNIFIADQIEKSGFLFESALDVKWVSDTKVELYYPDMIRVFKKEKLIEFGDDELHIKFKIRN